jgi:hypothetical protein
MRRMIILVIQVDGDHSCEMTAIEFRDAVRANGHVPGHGEVRKARVVDMPTDSADSMQVAS